MSWFGYYPKDNLAEAVVEFVNEKKSDNPEMPMSAIVNEVMEAVGYGVRTAMENIEDK